MSAAEKRVDLEVAGVSSVEALEVSAINLDDVLEGQRQEMAELVGQIFSEEDQALGRTTWARHHIDVGSARPVKQRYYYPVSKKLQEDMHRQVIEMLESGVIEPSTSAWSSPVVMIRTSNDKYRFCIDFRKLNTVSKADAYPLPYMDAILRKLKSAKYISTLDLSSAYHQIPLTAESKELMAFTVPGLGLYQLTRLPYGLSQAGATFQRLVDKVIGPELEPYAFSYLDDIIIATETYEEHLKWLKRIEEAGLTINREKSVFGKTEVKYLGDLVNRDGFRPDPEKIEPMLNFPVPKNLKQLRRFMGMDFWYRKFLKDFATIAEPLTALTKKDRRYEWGDTQQEAFEIKALVSPAPFSPDRRSKLSSSCKLTRATPESGTVLLQIIDGQERVLEFASRTLSPTDRNYSATQRECLAVIWAIKKFRPYIEGYHFLVVTDHSSLRWLHSLHSPTGRLARWALELQGHSFDGEHRKGALNHVTDALSRMFEEDDDLDVCASTWSDGTKDEWYQNWLDEVIRDPTTHPRWKAVGGRLFYFPADEIVEAAVADDEAWKLVVPQKHRREILRESHDDLTAGHQGREKTYERAARLYYWPKMYNSAKRYVR